jgi:hypothetical protein
MLQYVMNLFSAVPYFPTGQAVHTAFITPLLSLALNSPTKPAGHAVHALMFSSSALVPMEQGSELSLHCSPAADRLSCAQAAQGVVLSTSLLCVPAAQGLHAICPSSSVYLPGSQSLHVYAP